VRRVLTAALIARAEQSQRSKVRRFLGGLSYDELQFIAAYLGACILEANAQPRVDSEDGELKTILLFEYLSRGFTKISTH